MDILGAKASDIKRDHHILNAGDILLVFVNEFRLKFPVTDSEDVNLELSILAFQEMAVSSVGGNGATI